MATAMARGGISPNDFDALTFAEWAAIAQAIAREEESREQLEWERTRLLFYASLLPHLSSRKKPQERLPLPWDNEELQ